MQRLNSNPSKRNMKYFIGVISSLLISTSVIGQGNLDQVKKELTGINYTAKAKAYLKQNEKQFRGQLYTCNSNDTSYMDKIFLSTKIGEVFVYENQGTLHVFKILEEKETEFYKVQYIYLDNGKLDVKTIDSLRSVITKRLNEGETFESLAAEYSMDGNAKNGGNLGWFESGMMNATFEKAVKRHKYGQVFTVDIPSQKWYYVVKNSYQPKNGKQVTTLCIELKN